MSFDGATVFSALVSSKFFVTHFLCSATVIRSGLTKLMRNTETTTHIYPLFKFATAADCGAWKLTTDAEFGGLHSWFVSFT